MRNVSDKSISHEELRQLFGETFPIGVTEIAMNSIISPKAARLELIEVSKRIREGRAGPAMACTGCGCMESIEELRARDPKVLSCCPERKMIPAEDLITDLWKKAYGDK